MCDFGILGLENDFALMTDCQYGGRTMYKASCPLNFTLDHYLLNKINSSIYVAKLCDLVCATDFDLSHCSLHYGHLEQLANTCLNLQRLNLSSCYGCLKSLQGL